MDNERELLARVMYEKGNTKRDFTLLTPKAQEDYREEADAVLAAGWRKTNDSPKREWPVTEEAVDAFEHAPIVIGNDYETQATGLRAAAPFLWRARVEQLTDDELDAFPGNVRANGLRAALLALGAP